MTREEFINLDYEELAKDISQNITIRSYDEGGSRDDTRKATESEQKILFNILCAVFAAYRYRIDSNVDSIMDVAEMTLHRFIPNANSYDSIYIPVKKAMGLW